MWHEDGFLRDIDTYNSLFSCFFADIMHVRGVAHLLFYTSFLGCVYFRLVYFTGMHEYFHDNSNCSLALTSAEIDTDVYDSK